MTVTITITPVATNSTPLPTITIPVPTTNGFKIDFSAGFLVTGLVDFKYTTKPGAASGSYVINPPTSVKDQVGTAVFSPYYWRNRGWFKVGVSAGIVTQTNPIYALGIDFMAVSSQRLVLTLGEAGGDVSRVSGYQTGDTITTTTVPVANKFVTNPFLALSYNFN